MVDGLELFSIQSNAQIHFLPLLEEKHFKWVRFIETIFDGLEDSVETLLYQEKGLHLRLSFTSLINLIVSRIHFIIYHDVLGLVEYSN